MKTASALLKSPDPGELRAPPPEGVLAAYVSRDNLARELNVSPRTVTRWTYQVDGIPHLTIGLRTLYRRESVLQWLADREKKSSRTKRRA